MGGAHWIHFDIFVEYVGIDLEHRFLALETIFGLNFG